MPRRPPVAALALVLAAACNVTGPTTSNGVSVPAVNGSSTNTLLDCAILKGSLPKEITPGAALRPALPISDTTAAWGDPAVTLRCGVPEGNLDDEPFTVSGVQWAVHDTGTSHTWTSRGLKVHVAVLIPDTYQAQGELVATLAKPMLGSLKK